MPASHFACAALADPGGGIVYFSTSLYSYATPSSGILKLQPESASSSRAGASGRVRDCRTAASGSRHSESHARGCAKGGKTYSKDLADHDDETRHRSEQEGVTGGG